jgi:hypothetical protein
VSDVLRTGALSVTDLESDNHMHVTDPSERSLDESWYLARAEHATYAEVMGQLCEREGTQQ